MLIMKSMCITCTFKARVHLFVRWSKRGASEANEQRGLSATVRVQSLAIWGLCVISIVIYHGVESETIYLQGAGCLGRIRGVM